MQLTIDDKIRLYCPNKTQHDDKNIKTNYYYQSTQRIPIVENQFKEIHIYKCESCNFETSKQYLIRYNESVKNER